MTDAVPAPIRALADLFADAFAGVTFPDVDAASLGTAVGRVDTLAADVARLEDELCRARAALDGGRDELLRLASRAHAYARVYAEDDEALKARVDAVTLPRPKNRASGSTTLLPSPASSSASPSSASPSSAQGDAGPAVRKKRKAAPDDEAPLFTEAAAAAE